MTEEDTNCSAEEDDCGEEGLVCEHSGPGEHDCLESEFTTPSVRCCPLMAVSSLPVLTAAAAVMVEVLLFPGRTSGRITVNTCSHPQVCSVSCAVMLHDFQSKCGQTSHQRDCHSSPPLPLLGVSIVTERERQQNDSLVIGQARPQRRCSEAAGRTCRFTMRSERTVKAGRTRRSLRPGLRSGSSLRCSAPPPYETAAPQGKTGFLALKD